MRRLRILHVASFIGNIGDNASHAGLTNILKQLPIESVVSRMEIRNFYRNVPAPERSTFDNEFLAHANTYDLLIIGGGGFLDFCIPNSRTGTTIDMAPKAASAITVPTWITSVGCMPKEPIPDGNTSRFRAFLDALLSNPKVKLAIRNDGSKAILHETLGRPYSTAIPELLDHGFFYESTAESHWLHEKDYVAINLASDQLSLAFRDPNTNIDERGFYRELASVCTYLLHQLKVNIVLVPHVYHDLNAITKLFSHISDTSLRKRVVVAPYVQGHHGADTLFHVYKNSRFIIATRLHANIVGIAMNKLVYGLAALKRTACLHDSIGSSNYVSVKNGFSEKLMRKLPPPESYRIREITCLDTALSRDKNKLINTYTDWASKLIVNRGD